MRALVRAHPSYIVAIETNAAADVTSNADNRIYEGSLTHTVAAEQRQRLAFGDLETDIRQDDCLAIAGSQPFNIQKVRHRSAPRRDKRL
jgi:hypothetical protein